MAELDIFNPQVSVIADGLEGKVIFIYGSNSTGKTFQSVRFSKPYVIAAESGLNGQAGVRFGRVTNWRGFTKIVKQFTSPSTAAVPMVAIAVCATVLTALTPAAFNHFFALSLIFILLPTAD